MCWKRKCSVVSSSNSLTTVFSSLVAFPYDDPDGHLTLGRLKSPHKTMSGNGDGRLDMVSLIAPRALQNFADVERCIPLRSSGCLYTTMSTRFSDFT